MLGASARSVYTGYAIQMGAISFLGVGYLSMFGGVLERGIEGLISGYGLKGSWNYAIEDGRVLSDFAGGLLFAGLTMVASKLLGAFLYGGSRENYYTKSIIPELPYQGYGLTPGGVQLPQGMEAGRGSREAAAFLMNLWQNTGQNRAFLPGSKPLELGDGSKGSGENGQKVEGVRHEFQAPGKRHYYSRISKNSKVADLNTIIDPNVDVKLDVELINSGQAVRKGNDFVINNRTYGVTSNGELYPKTGEGFYLLDRGVYKALIILKQFGNTELGLLRLKQNRILPDKIKEALRIYEILTGN